MRCESWLATWPHATAASRVVPAKSCGPARRPHRLRPGAAVPLGLGHGLLLPEQEVEDETASGVSGPFLAAMLDNFLVVAPGIEQGVGKDWYVTPSPLFVDDLGQTHDKLVVPGKDCWVDAYCSEQPWAEDIPDEVGQRPVRQPKLAGLGRSPAAVVNHDAQDLAGD